MSETTKEILVRRMVAGDPPNFEHSVAETQVVEVEVVWPNGKPKNDGSYCMYGTWELARKA